LGVVRAGPREKRLLSALFVSRQNISMGMIMKKLAVVLLILVSLGGCSIFDITKGGVQVSPLSDQLEYDMYGYNGAICVKGDGFDICHKKHFSPKDSSLRIDRHKTNLGVRCESVGYDSGYKCITAMQVAGMYGGDPRLRNGRIREWGPERCDWVFLGPARPCDEIDAYVVSKKKDQQELKQANSERLNKKRDECVIKTEKLRRNIKEGDNIRSGLVVEVKDQIVLVQQLDNAVWIKKSDVVAIC